MDDKNSFLHAPEHATGDGMVLTHGAGGNHKMPLLVAVAEALAKAGITVLRCDLAFRQKRPGGGPSPSGQAADREGLRQAAKLLRERVKGKVFMGGQSYGGRMASMIAAEDPSCMDGLLLLSYPLHPPGKPESLRTQHFATIACPTLFVHGAKDPFGTFEELKAAVKLIPAKKEIRDLANAGHDLARGKFDLQGDLVVPFQGLTS